MKKTVCTAKIDECTKVGNILYSAFHNIPNLDLCKKLLCCLSFAGKKDLLSVTDNPVSSGIEFRDDKFNFLIRIFIKISFICIRDKACGDKYTGFINDNAESAVSYLSNLSGKNLFVLKCFLQPLIALLGCKSLVGKYYLSVAVIYLHNLCLEFITRYKKCGKIRCFITVLFFCEHTIEFISDIQIHHIRLYSDDGTFNDLSIPDSFERFVKKLVKTFFF